MSRDCPTSPDVQRSQSERPFEPRQTYREFKAYSNDNSAQKEQLCYLCNKPRHFAANCPKAAESTDPKSLNLGSASATPRN